MLLGGFLCFETPSLCGLVLFLLLRMPDLLAACLDFTVVVRDGAIVEIYGVVDRETVVVEIYLSSIYFCRRTSGEIWQNSLSWSLWRGG